MLIMSDAFGHFLPANICFSLSPCSSALLVLPYAPPLPPGGASILTFDPVITRHRNTSDAVDGGCHFAQQNPEVCGLGVGDGCGGGGVGTRPWWLALLGRGGAYWPLALEPSAMTSRHPHCRGHPPAWGGLQNATSAHGVLP